MRSFEAIATFLCPIKETTYDGGERDQYAKENRNQHRRGINANMTPSEPLDSTGPETRINSRCLQLVFGYADGLSFVLKLF